MGSRGGNKKPLGNRPTIRTLADLNRSSDHGSDSDSDGPQEYYTGGEKRCGFTVNDGPLRRFDDPENAAFLESIMKSECPKELEPADRRSVVHVNLVRRAENCPEPARRLAPFQGAGRTLGSGSSNSSGSELADTATASSSTPSSSTGLAVDESKPSTTMQLRLADGTRMIARFNTQHTVANIRSFIDASRPGAPSSYQLQTVGFPPKQLNDPSKTIEEAGLANSVVIQKL
ncbi:plant UBX domain-containing protein 3-like [Musa acuminata AAA Group]|uniref:plant UBX domain-containing protein 3-like n=1 Tax=Musa acuminata AAA Group TaxID=214697 RepID=UPI0031D9DAAD